MLFTQNQEFYHILTTKSDVPCHYSKLEYLLEKPYEFYAEDKAASTNCRSDSVVSLNLFPDYLKPVFDKKIWKVITLPQKKIEGFSIVIKETTDIDTFMKTEFSKSFRQNIMRFLNRFEGCFNVTYKMYHGEISKENYDTYMSKLYDMLTVRFDQRNDDNKVLNNWKYYLDTTFKMINSGKASLFVIYHNNNPVQISLNHHYNNILFVSIPSFDLDYFRFSLGNISIYKLVEWALNNNYRLVDMAYGKLEYKRRWSNHNYGFSHHVIASENTIKNRLGLFLETKKIQFKNYLKTKNIDEQIDNLKKKIRAKNSSFKDEASFEVTPVSSLDTSALNKINIENNEHSLIRKYIFDYLYEEKVNVDTIPVFEVIPQREYVIGDASMQQRNLSITK